MNFQLVFFGKAGDKIDFTIEGVVIDFNSINYTTQLGKGENDLTFDVAAEDNNAIVIRMFSTVIYEAWLYLGTILVWAGIRPLQFPKFSKQSNKLSVTFIGYYDLLNRRKISKVWVDKLATAPMIGPLYRQPNASQRNGRKDLDGSELTTQIARDDILIAHGTERYFLTYTAVNGQTIQAVEGGKISFRSGQGMEVRFINQDYGVLFRKYDLSDTGDQTTLKTVSLPYTTVTGGKTKTIEYRTGASNSAAATVYNYGTGTTEITNTLQGTIGDNCLVIRFDKNFTTVIQSVEILLNSNGDYKARAAIYNDSGNYLDEFDNGVVLSNQASPINYTFTYNGGMDIGVSTGITYYLVIRVDEGGADVDVTTVGANSGGGYVANGYLRHGILTGAFPNFSGTFTEPTPLNTTWVKVKFNLDVALSDVYDQNDLVKMELLKVYSSYIDTHTQYLIPTYTGPELIQDALLSECQEIEFDPALIPSGINNDLPFEAAGEVTPLSVGEALKKIYSVFSGGGELYPMVWASKHGGQAKFELIQRSDIVENPIYALDTTSDNVVVSVNNQRDVRNYIFVKYKDESGIDRIASPVEYLQLVDGDPLDLGLDRVDYFYDSEKSSLTEALQAGVGIKLEYQKARQSGRITITGPDAITTYDEGSTGLIVSPAAVTALDKFVLVGFVDYDGTPNPVYQCTKTSYNVGNGKLVIEFGNDDFSASVFKKLKLS